MEKPSRGESYPLPKWQAIGFKKIHGAPQRTKVKDIPPCSKVCCSVPRSAECSYVRCSSGWETQVRAGQDRKLSSQRLFQFHFICTVPYSFPILMLLALRAPLGSLESGKAIQQQGRTVGLGSERPASTQALPLGYELEWFLWAF